MISVVVMSSSGDLDDVAGPHFRPPKKSSVAMSAPGRAVAAVALLWNLQSLALPWIPGAGVRSQRRQAFSLRAR